MPLPFRLIDVFGQGPFTGNALAVVHDADGLDADAMQAVARWLNLSETAFLLRPTQAAADYRVRIFTLEHELPFAGHPTLGSAHAWLEAGGRPAKDGAVVQECGAGLVDLRRTDAGLAFAAPPLVRSGPLGEDELAETVRFTGVAAEDVVDARWVDNGPGWRALLLRSAEAVLAVEPARDNAGRLKVGLVGPHAAGGDADFELRAFFPDAQGATLEDPVTGSLNASVAQWLFESGRAQGRYRAAQGARLGRAGRVAVEQAADGAVWIGGRTATLFAGETID
ncbi:MAG: PhzF family phenazine biosynthesis protein [Caulobacteraceae bacterium]|nr:PhzF family phenazine biosynthesis protein [Caulobacter sp.]